MLPPEYRIRNCEGGPSKNWSKYNPTIPRSNRRLSIKLPISRNVISLICVIDGYRVQWIYIFIIIIIIIIIRRWLWLNCQSQLIFVEERYLPNSSFLTDSTRERGSSNLDFSLSHPPTICDRPTRSTSCRPQQQPTKSTTCGYLAICFARQREREREK